MNTMMSAMMEQMTSWSVKLMMITLITHATIVLLTDTRPLSLSDPHNHNQTLTPKLKCTYNVCRSYTYTWNQRLPPVIESSTNKYENLTGRDSWIIYSSIRYPSATTDESFSSQLFKISWPVFYRHSISDLLILNRSPNSFFIVLHHIFWQIHIRVWKPYTLVFTICPIFHPSMWRGVLGIETREGFLTKIKQYKSNSRKSIRG